MKIYFFSGTHWDREWYQTYQGFRFKLVKMLDQLIEGLEQNNDYGVFHLDGQTIILDDYLAIRPQNRTRLEKLIQSGKLLIGPWYCMPDEFLLSGESLIKNLQLGHRIARTYGHDPLKYGYICDIFGHIAQMPQIFKEFGIRHALLGRGTNEHTTPSHFTWEGIDDSRITSFKLADGNGYGNFSWEVVTTNDKSVNQKERIKKLVDYEINRSNLPIVLLMDAIDHNFYDENTPEYISTIKELYPDSEVYHTSIMDMCKELDQYNNIPIKKGEIYEPARDKKPYLHLIANTLSSRYPLKKYNDRVQTILEKQVHPLHAFGLVDVADGFLDLANQYLLQNHPHDSICGCSIDQVHKDMIYRFDQAYMIGSQILDEFRNNSKKGERCSNKVIKIYNPLPYSYKRVIEVEIDFELDYPTKYQEPFGYELINSFKIYDTDGNEIPYGINDIKTNYCKRVYNQNVINIDYYKVVLEIELIPMGFIELSVVPFEEAARCFDRMPQTENKVSNEFIELTIQHNGCLTIYDKRTEKEYRDLLTIVDDGDIGDGSYHVNPVCDISITNTTARIEKVENNVNRVTFRITQNLLLPEQVIGDKFGIRRSDKYIPYDVIHYVSLSRGEAYVAIKTKVKNIAKNHRLRLKFPTNIKGSTYYANQPFCFVERHTDVDYETKTWKECEVLEKPMSGIVMKEDKQGGFAFVSEYGLHECGVTEQGDINVTLLRSTGKTVFTNGEIGGQLLEELEYSYVLLPFTAGTSLAHLQKQQDILQTGVISVNYNCDKPRKHESIFEIDSDNILFSTANKNKKGIEIRIYNMSDKPDKAILHLPPCNNVYSIDLDGNMKKPYQIIDNTLSMELDKWRFETILLM